ncbi:MAG: hypothetical protein M3Q31_02375 [Actinomycetota bacterium]|nr:hypothetical protein [Actinomycetota bacterium]
MTLEIETVGPAPLDPRAQQHMLDYEALMRNPETAPFQYLHAGSTDHENYQFEAVPIAESGDDATNDAALERMLDSYIAPALDFFDAFLAGRADPAELARVRWHLARAGWQESPSWPPPGAGELRLYLAGDSVASAPGGHAEATWVHDPENLVPSTLVNPFEAPHEYPDERGIESREDVLTSTTAVRDEPVTLAGRVAAHLYVSSDAPSMYLHVKLVDVHAGRSRPRAAVRPAGRREWRPRRARRGLPRPHRLPRAARAPAAPAGGLERLSGLPPASGHRREPVGCDRDADDPADPGDRRRHAFVPQPHHARLER